MCLTDGVKRFYQQKLADLKQLFENLATGQSPHTLFITCSDSRVVPNLIVDAKPGELFVVRNIANMVPDYTLRSDYFETFSAIEYAVSVLSVKNIVICGHSDCGGCKALKNSYFKMKDSPLRKWLGQSEELLKKFGNEGLDVLEKENVIYQIGKIKNYPFVKERLEKKELRVFGWYFHIKTGEVFDYNFENNKFEPI